MLNQRVRVSLRILCLLILAFLLAWAPASSGEDGKLGGPVQGDDIGPPTNPKEQKKNDTLCSKAGVKCFPITPNEEKCSPRLRFCQVEAGLPFQVPMPAPFETFLLNGNYGICLGDAIANTCLYLDQAWCAKSRMFAVQDPNGDCLLPLCTMWYWRENACNNY